MFPKPPAVAVANERLFATLPGDHVPYAHLREMVERMADDRGIEMDDPEREEWINRVTWESLEGQVIYDEPGYLLGLCTLMPRERWSEQHVADFRIWLDPSVRGKGVGTELYKWAEASAKEDGIERVEAINYETNEKAHNWLLSLGFKNEGLRRHAIRTNHGFISAYVMGKVL